ncbi:unnamed protein product, partial [Rangifer tarandus platyrhynchus]
MGLMNFLASLDASTPCHDMAPGDCPRLSMAPGLRYYLLQEASPAPVMSDLPGLSSLSVLDLGCVCAPICPV